MRGIFTPAAICFITTQIDAGEAAQAARAATDAKAGVETVCIPAGGATVETAHAAHVDRVELDPCKPWQHAFMDFMTVQAFADSPACTARAYDPDSNEYRRLLACVLVAAGEEN